MLHHHYNEAENIPLLFLHGYCEDLSMWNEYLDAFIDHTTLAIDLPGFGQSPTSEKLSIESMAQEVNQVIEHLSLKEVIVIGHSMGGYVAVALSRLLEKKLKGLCMFHSHPYEDDPALKEKRTKANDFIEKNGVEKFALSLLPSLFAPNIRSQYRIKIVEMTTAVSQLSEAALINAMTAMRDRPAMQSWVEALSCPYHCILGTEDVPTPLSLCLPQINLADITKMTILKDVGHMGMFTAKAATQEALKDFVRHCSQKITF